MTPSDFSLRSIDAQRASETVRRGLTSGGSCDPLAFDCALLRGCLWSVSRGVSAVHVLRVLNSAVGTLLTAGIDTDETTARDRLRETLDVLDDVGDVINLPGGRWFPAPVREVALSTPTDERLILGGVPTGSLPPDLALQLVHHGPFRRTHGGAIAAALSLPTEPLASWLGTSSVPLQEWGRQKFGVTLAEYREPGDNGRFRVYAPDRARPQTPQGFRWVAQMPQLDGRYFGYRELPFGIRRPRLLHVVQGHVRATGVPALGRGEARRLLYALDAIAGNPVAVTVHRKEHSFEVTLHSELPRAEQRIFGALGTLSLSNTNSYYPRTWAFHHHHESKVLAELLGLGVRILEKATRSSPR